MTTVDRADVKKVIKNLESRKAPLGSETWDARVWVALQVLAEFALSLDERLGDNDKVIGTHLEAHNRADAPPEAQPQRRLKDGYAIDWDPDGVQRCVYSCDIRGTPAQIVGPVGSPEVERCYEDPQNKPFCDTTTGADTDSPADAAPDGYWCGACFKNVKGETVVRCENCGSHCIKKRDDAQEVGE